MNRWEQKPLQSWLVRVVAVAIPLIAAVSAALLMTKVLPTPVGSWQLVAWWGAVVGASLAVMVLVLRLARRLLPLSVLLSLSLAFPGQAPSRFRIAFRAWSSTTVARQTEEARNGNGPADALSAAEFLLTLLASLGAHDPRTRGHSARTRAYTDLIAEELHLSAVEIDRLRWVSLLHDIGKLAVPVPVLHREGPLDEEDWAHLRHHPSIGYELTRPLHEFLGGWEKVILHHHERYDGYGYPNGLRHDEIAFGARIVSVADAFDAMTASRSYKDAIPAAAARKELAYRAGTQFDPVVVRAFLNVSTSRMHRLIGPLAALASIPFVGAIRRFGQSGALGAATAFSVAALGVTGVVDLAVGTADGASPAAESIVLAEAIEAPGFIIDVAASDPAIVPASVTVADAPPSVEANANGDGTVTVRPPAGFAGTVHLEIAACTDPDSCSQHEIELLVNLDGSPTLLAAPAGTTARALPPRPVDATTGEVADTAAATSATTSSAVMTTVPTTTFPVATTTTVPATTTTVPVTTTTPVPTTTTVPVTTTTTVPVTTTTTTVPVTTTTTVPAATTTTTVPVTTTTTTTTTVPVTTTTTTTPTTTTTTTIPDGAPTAQADDVTIDEDAATLIDVLANDSDEDLANVTITVTKDPTEGTAVVIGDQVLFTPAADDHSNRNFDYEICDAAGQCDTARVDVTITAVNDAPVAVDDTEETRLGEKVRVTVLDNDTDVDNTDLRVDVALSDTTSALGGTIDCSKNGDEECEYDPPAGWTGTADTFSYVVTDQNGGTATATVTITEAP